MARFLISLFVGAVVGIGGGLYLGWVQFPVEYIDSPARSLNPRFQDEYTIMVAAGFVMDDDLQGVVDRLRLLNVDNVPQFVQETTERYITNSRDVDEIRLLVALSEGLGRLTPIMEPYRQVSVPGDDPS